MATEATTTTRPARARKATTTTAKAASKVAPAAPAAAETVTRFKIDLEHVSTTKSYEKFAVPDNYKGTVVGNIYAPIGTERVAILVIGAGDNGDD